MSNRLVKNGMSAVKNGSGLVLPGSEDVLVELIVTRAGVQLKAPNVPPNEVCKILNSIAVDIMFSSFQPVEKSSIQPV